jgi:hypothetical protein
MRRATLSALSGAARLLAAGPIPAGAARTLASGPRARVAVSAAAGRLPGHTRGFAAAPSDSDDGWEDVDVLYPAASAFVGEQAPRFEAPALVDGEPGRLALDDYLKQGKYVCLFFYPKGERGGGGEGGGKGGGGGGGVLKLDASSVLPPLPP